MRRIFDSITVAFRSDDMHLKKNPENLSVVNDSENPITGFRNGC